MRHSTKLIIFLIAGLICWHYPLYAQEDRPIFREVSEEASLGSNRIGSDKVIGQAWGDFDSDGWIDLYVTAHAGPTTLYRNQSD
ncbi:MAG: hypothetical protein AAF633_14730, partial [Chloroflexota bacterium]